MWATVNVVRKRQIPWARGILYGLYQRRLRRGLNPAVLPGHVAMIIDGNRRWAKQLGFDSAAHGHRAGAAKMLEFLTWCDDLGISVVTLYLLSSDNLTNRESEELSELSKIIAKLAEELSRYRDWRVQQVGNKTGLPEDLVAALDAAEARTARKKGLHINLAVGYGGRSEITDAMRSIVGAHLESGGTLADLAETLTPDLIGAHLYTGGQPDPDLVIRTSGEQRISDFMLWQSAHSEFYFVEALGPDLRQVDFLRALRDFAKRQRRFGS
ncbi:isoprenyl transferase [Cryobacterium sp. PH31-AA6]|uniref:isoprenyl transferase n=1 Tax=Cryobacterium sp. PH31-AA6 TaxID=3046205 RepID=UPI0024BA5FAE|nr:isoprenyl transferase [Cryobacterium sp. PH31-AA6]MDJ0322932.1 isoprenyl transferase [Cryobacterium sp. PH31-AA6]